MRSAPTAEPTGVEALDKYIGGWPNPGVASIHGAVGSGRMGLILPALKRHTQAGRTIAIVDPLGWLYPPGLPGLDLQHLMMIRCGGPKSGWATIQLAASGALGMVVLLDPPPLRRDGLRLLRATESGHSTVVVLTERPDPHLTAPIRLHSMGNQRFKVERGAVTQPIFCTG